MTIVRAIQNFGYSGDLMVRDAIRRFHGLKKNNGVSYGGDRGPIVEVTIGDELDAPVDLLDSWLEAELVEVV